MNVTNEQITHPNTTAAQINGGKRRRKTTANNSGGPRIQTQFHSENNLSATIAQAAKAVVAMTAAVVLAI